MTDNYKTIQFTVPDDVNNIRLDKYVGRDDNLKNSRSRIQKLIEAGLVAVDEKPASHNHVIAGGEKITIRIPPPSKSDVSPEDIPLDIIYEDDSLLVVNKPAGMVTHPAAGNYSGTMVNALLHYSRNLSQVQGGDRPGIVHRLDKNTSGLIIVAKSDHVHLALQNQLRERNIKRTYTALICGHIKQDTGTIELPVGRSIKDRKKMTVTNLKARHAITEYRLVDRFRLYDLLEVNLKTGRTHQIRVHFSHLGHPVFGDPDYGGRVKWHRGIFTADRLTARKALKIMERQALHACRLEFSHPEGGEKISLEAPLPDDYRNLLDYLEIEGR